MYLYIYVYIHIYIYIYIYIYSLDAAQRVLDLEAQNIDAIQTVAGIYYVSCLQLSSCINVMNFCVYYLCHIGGVYVFYVGHVERIDYMQPFSML
jgi:hypothetical protein